MADEKPSLVPSPVPDPVKHPTIKIGDVDFEVKFTMLQVMRLEESGISFTEKFDDNGVTRDRPRMTWTLREIFTGLAVMLSSAARKYTAEEVAEMIPHENAGEVMTVFATAVKKVLSQAKRATTNKSPGDAASQSAAN